MTDPPNLQTLLTPCSIAVISTISKKDGWEASFQRFATFIRKG